MKTHSAQVIKASFDKRYTQSRKNHELSIEGIQSVDLYLN